MALIDYFQPANKKKFKDLREWQKSFFKIWDSDVKENTELACVNLPTGCGKTLVGLQILKKYLKKDKKRCAYIINEYALADKVLEHAKDLDIPAVIIRSEKASNKDNIPRNKRKKNIINYLRSQVIRISSYDFELYHSKIEPPEILIIDDADRFIQNLNRISSVTISREECPDFYQEILNKLDPSNYDRLEAIINNNTNRFEVNLVYPHESVIIANWIQNERATKIIGDSKYPKNLQWQLRRNWRELGRMLMTFNNEKIIFRPFFPAPRYKDNIFKIPKIILMSATLGTIISIQKELGVIKKNVLMINEESLKNEELKMGNRIVFPIDEVDELEQAVINKSCLKIVNNFDKSLIMSYSGKEQQDLFEKFSTEGKKSIIYQNNDDLTKFISGKKVHLIAASKYYGIDLPLKTCNVGIITWIPKYLDHFDYIYNDLIKNKEYIFELIARRLTQAFGRCNRDIDDIAIYFVLDQRFSRDMYKPTYLKYFSKLIFSEINLGCELNDWGDLEKSIETGKNFLNGKIIDYEKKLKEQAELYNYTEAGDSSDITFAYEIDAWDNFQREGLEKSWSILDDAIDILENYFNENPEFKNVDHLCWLLYCKAMILTYGILKFKDEEFFQIYEETRKKIMSLSINPFYNRFVVIKPGSAIENKEDPNNILESWVKNPAVLFGEELWESDEFLSLKDNIIQGLKALAVGSNIPAIKSFSTDLEGIFNEICKSQSIKITTRGNRSPTLSDFITNLKSNNLITKETDKIGTIYDNNLMSLRNGFIHNIKTIKTPTECVKILLKYIEYINRVFKDLYFYKLLNNHAWNDTIGSFKSSKSPSAKHYAKLSVEEIKKKIIGIWVEGSPTVYFNPKPFNREYIRSYRGDIVFKSKGLEAISIPIRLNL